MNWLDILLLITSIAVLNVLMYWLFTRFFLTKENGAMKFLGLNLLKDLIWTLVWLSLLDRDTREFLVLIGVFLVSSFLLYSKVIKRLNKL